MAHRYEKYLPDLRFLPRRERLVAIAEAKLSAELEGFCMDCGNWHSTERRLRVLGRYNPLLLNAHELAEDWPCFWGDGDNGKRQLYRDLDRLGWYAPGARRPPPPLMGTITPRARAA